MYRVYRQIVSFVSLLPFGFPMAKKRLGMRFLFIVIHSTYTHYF